MLLTMRNGSPKWRRNSGVDLRHSKREATNWKRVSDLAKGFLLGLFLPLAVSVLLLLIERAFF